MDNVLYFLLLEQMLAGLTVAGAVVYFGRAIRNVLVTMTDPHLHISIVGDGASGVMNLENHSPCEIIEVAIEVYAGDEFDSGDIRQPIYAGNWKSIGQGVAIKTEEFVIDQAHSRASAFPPSELLVRWTLIRSVDGRRFGSAVTLKPVVRANGPVEFLSLTERLRLSAGVRTDAGQPAASATRTPFLAAHARAAASPSIG